MLKDNLIQRRTPRHVVIIMDGNGRWAKKRCLPRIAGHRAGAQIIHRIVEHASKRNIDVLTLFAFSLENHSRPSAEVNFLMSLFLDSLKKNTDSLIKNNICLRITGDRSLFSNELLTAINLAESKTANNTGLILVVAINYSGRWDITQAFCCITKKILSRQISESEISSEMIAQHLTLSDLPEPDLLIRTSGEQRLSNFMLWQIAYTEIYFTKVCWPDFNCDTFDEALDFFKTRQRRFGRTPEQIEKKIMKKVEKELEKQHA